MCGIAGIHRYRTGRPVEEAELLAMTAAIRHRGPDDEGTFVDRDAGLGNRRLKVIDLSPRGHQPMVSDDGRVAITYNGEVYNHVELRRELAARGHVFRSRTDTEVLLRLYEERGEGMLEALNGMFAFAIWDGRRRRLLLARDRLGIKPLYLAHTADGLAFSSEVRPLLGLLGHRPTVRVSGLDSYLRVGYVPSPHTLFAEIEKLPPATLLTVERGRLTRRVWWEPPAEPRPRVDARAEAEAVRELLRDAVRLQLRSDAPLGVFLSGGVDSSAVVALMRELGVEEIRAFTAAFDAGPGFDETPWARLAARRFGAHAEEVFLGPDAFTAGLGPMVRAMEEPVADPAAVPLAAIARRARESVTVVLSGEGADEVFGGYPVYGHMTLIERWRALPGIVRAPLAAGLGALGPKWRKYLALADLPLERRYLGLSLTDPTTLARLGPLPDPGPDALAERLAPIYAAAGGDAVHRMSLVDLATWLPDDLLVKADKMTMASSLELRVPFLDHRLVELGLSLPSALRVRRWSTKRLLRRALAPVLPPELAGRRKVGFPVPLAALFRGPLGDHAAERFEDPASRARGWFLAGTQERLLAEHRRGEADHHRLLWQLLVLEEWHHELIDAAAATPARPACGAARSRA